MGHHLGFNNKSNVLRRHLNNKNVAVEKCAFQLVAYGPILEEASTRDDHFKSRDIIAAFDKELADCMKKSGYDVINTANCKKTLDPDLWAKVNDAFAEHFPKLKRVTENRTGCSD